MTNLRVSLLTTAIAAGLFASAVDAKPRGGMERERPSFTELDTNSDGVLSQEELQAPMQERFAAADTNGDGALSAEELAEAAQTRRAERMVQRLDQNDDGLIQAEEMMAGRGDRSPMERIDVDGNGEISEEEFADAQERHGDRGDRRGKRGHGHGHGDRDGRGHGGDRTREDSSDN